MGCSTSNIDEGGADWTVIQRHHPAGSWIRLRPAANIIGFRLFPIGWTWSEYAVLTRGDSLSYDATFEACRKSRVSAAKRDTALSQNGAKYRRRKVETELRRVLREKIVKYKLGKEYWLHDDAKQLRDLRVHRDLSRYDWNRLNVENSRAAVYTLYRGCDITVDAHALIKHFSPKPDGRGRPSETDWNWVEAKVRSILETDGVPRFQSQLEAAVQGSYANSFPHQHEPNVRTLQDRIRRLKREYKAI